MQQNTRLLAACQESIEFVFRVSLEIRFFRSPQDILAKKGNLRQKIIFSENISQEQADVDMIAGESNLLMF
jgi:hypothetical protein